MAEMAFGFNGGHGYVKMVALDGKGNEAAAVVLPSQIAPATEALAGAVAEAETVAVGGRKFWVGQAGDLSDHPLTNLSTARLDDQYFIPALVKGALAQAALNGRARGVCVTGLPAIQAGDEEKAASLAARLKEGSTAWSEVRVIAEPLGLLYGVLLSNMGSIVNDSCQGRVAVIDLGHLTVDVAEVDNLRTKANSLDSWSLGTSAPLGRIRSLLSATWERELTLQQVDQAVRDGGMKVAGRFVQLPDGWNAPIIGTADALVARLQEKWGRGNQFDAILVGGGGAELSDVTNAIRAAFPHAEVVPEPQMAVARGYARLARYTLNAKKTAAAGEGGEA